MLDFLQTLKIHKYSFVPASAGRQPFEPEEICGARFSDQPETVEAQRRRRGSGPSGRADMPERPSSSEGGGGSSGGGGGSYRPSLGGIPGGKRGLPVGLVVVLLVAFFLCRTLTNNQSDLSGGQDQQSQQPVQEEQVWDTPVAIPVAADTQAVAATRPAGSANQKPGQTWTVMLYQDADDPVLEQDIYMDLNEAERVGSSDQVNVVAQIDRYDGAFDGDGDWTSTRRYYLTPDNDLNRLNSPMIEDMGELSMSDPQTLVDFAAWAMKAYPADKYVLILSDHGMGWPGGWTDPKPGGRTNSSAPLASMMKTPLLLTDQLDRALAQIQTQTGLDRFEVIGLDACLMSHMEVYSALAPYARTVVTSQETEPALGWAYASFLETLEKNPGMDGAELGRQIVSSYIDKDERIVDDQARADFLRQGSPLASLFGQPADIDPRQLSKQLGKAITLTTADMGAYPGLVESLNNLTLALKDEDQAVVAKARTYAQSYTSIFGKDVPPSYIDLGSFVQIIQQESRNGPVKNAAADVLSNVKKVVIAEKHGPEKEGSTGISIYFPNSALYRSPATGPQSYTRIADRFAADTLWDDYLAFHYTRAPFTAETRSAAIPAEGTRVTAPGAGQFEVSPLKLSVKAANYDEPVTMQSVLKGRNIGYVYLFVGFFDPASKSVLIADQDYLEAPRTKQIGDLYYPNWSDKESFNLKYTWTPSVFSIDDGQQTVVARFKPERYGATPEEAVYSVDGTYEFGASRAGGSSGDTQPARLYFVNGTMQSAFGFTGSEAAAAPREILPQAGDRFTLTQSWLEPDGQGGYRQMNENGKTLTFGEQMFTWKEQYAAAGDYVVGFVVSDLDGNEQQTFGTVKIK